MGDIAQNRGEGNCVAPNACRWTVQLVQAGVHEVYGACRQASATRTHRRDVAALGAGFQLVGTPMSVISPRDSHRGEE